MVQRGKPVRQIVQMPFVFSITPSKPLKAPGAYHDQCLFFACYIFDDNIYVTPYPLTRPEQLETSV